MYCLIFITHIFVFKESKCAVNSLKLLIQCSVLYKVFKIFEIIILAINTFSEVTKIISLRSAIKVGRLL